MFLRMYHIFVNKNFAVKKRYESFVLSHIRLHRKFKFISWLYLFWISICFNVFHISDKKKIKFKNESGISLKKNAKDIAYELCQSNLISFDMFDTLVLRPFSEPTDLFYIVGEKLDIPDFKSIRINAERTAREQSISKCGNGEVTLAQIYEVLESQLFISGEYGAFIESQIEIDLCMANPFMLKVWNEVISSGKHVIIITDMYLPRDILEDMLLKCGFKGYERLFLSNEMGYGKYNGKLYDYVKSIYNNCNYSHIGDNRNADFIFARKSGFNPILYPNLNKFGDSYRTDRMSYIIGSAYRGIVNKRMYCMDKCTPAFEYGYKYGGILILGFCDFIHENAKHHNADKILFFARDGYIVKQVYDNLYPDDRTEYVYWSRASAAKLCADIYPQDYFRRFLEQKVNRGITIFEVMQSMDISSLDISLQKNLVLTDKNISDLKSELYSKINEIVELYSDMYEQANDYLYNILNDCHKAVTVDCGWAGSGSILFDAYVNRKMKMKIDIIGLLAGSNSRNQIDSDFSEVYFKTKKLISYCFSSEHNREYYETHFPAKKHNIYFELLFGAPEPSFIGFSKQGLVFDTESENKDIIKEIHAGEIAFIEDYIKSFHDYSYMMQISGSDAYAPFLSVISNGDRYISSIFKDCVFDETVAGKKERL